MGATYMMVISHGEAVKHGDGIKQPLGRRHGVFARGGASYQHPSEARCQINPPPLAYHAKVKVINGFSSAVVVDEPRCIEACVLQTCLSRNTYEPEKCDEQLKSLYMYLCCSKMYEQDDKAESMGCPMSSVVRRWLRAHPGPKF